MQRKFYIVPRLSINHGIRRYCAEGFYESATNTKETKLINNKIFWKVLGSGLYAPTNSLVLSVFGIRHIFNCGEGTDRMIGYLKLRRAVSSHLYITSTGWQNIGGVPGYALLTRKYGGVGLEVHGPPGCLSSHQFTGNSILDRGKFKIRNSINQPINQSKTVYEDDDVKITGVPLMRDKPLKRPGYNLSWQAQIRQKVRDLLSSGENYSSTVMAYICKIKTTGYTAIVLEIPDSGYLDPLYSSSDLQLPPEDVNTVFHLTPPHILNQKTIQLWMERYPGSQHIFLNCTDSELIFQNKYRELLRQISPSLFPPMFHHQEDFQLSRANCFHLDPSLSSNLPSSSSTTSALSASISPSSSEESISSDSSVATSISSSGSFNTPLTSSISSSGSFNTPLTSSISSRSFNTPITSSIFSVSSSSSKIYRNNLNIIQAELGLQIGVFPLLEFKWFSRSSGFDEKEFPENCVISQENNNKENTQEFPEIAFIGTGSAVPNINRNVSCILVEVEKDKFVMLDCGEGSLSELYRLYGLEEMDRRLINLKSIFISHQHTDHHMGLNSIILARESAARRAGVKLKNVFIICSGFYAYILARYHTQIQPVLRNAIFVNARSLLQGVKVSESRSEKYDKKDELLKYTGLNEIQTCEAVHSKDSYSIAFRTAVGGYKITYSGDTRPNNQLVDIGRDSDLLIHEATYSNSGRDEAKLRMHSTTAEAVQVGRMMNAKFTVLTHFQRLFYRVPLMDDFQDEANVGIAFDGMVVNLKSMYSIPDMYPDLKRIFEDDIKDIKDILRKDQTRKDC